MIPVGTATDKSKEQKDFLSTAHKRQRQTHNIYTGPDRNEHKAMPAKCGILLGFAGNRGWDTLFASRLLHLK